MCDALGVSRSGYYGWLSRQPSARALSGETPTEKIHLAYEVHRHTYGYRRVTSDLNEARGEAVGRHRAARLMKRQVFLAAYGDH
jgi:putative transposase